MDAARFDRITRMLAIAPSRRELLGFASGGVGGLLGRAETVARKRGRL
jgi:hypothetical protein